MTRRYAIVVDGRVANTAVATEPQDEAWIESDSAAVGDLYDGTEFTRPAPQDVVIITKVQAISAMSEEGMLNQFQSYLDTAPQLTRTLWEAAYELHSDSPMLLTAWSDMGRSAGELYDLFMVAKDIKV